MKLKMFHMPVFHDDMQKVTSQTVLHDMIHHSEKNKKGKKTSAVCFCWHAKANHRGNIALSLTQNHHSR